jgi:hypothetical protein
LTELFCCVKKSHPQRISLGSKTLMQFRNPN